MRFDERTKSRRAPTIVIPAKAGIQEKPTILDPGFRRGDVFNTFREAVIFCALNF
jgi:hypothetical protein